MVEQEEKREITHRLYTKDENIQKKLLVDKEVKFSAKIQ